METRRHGDESSADNNVRFNQSTSQIFNSLGTSCTASNLSNSRSPSDLFASAVFVNENYLPATIKYSDLIFFPKEQNNSNSESESIKKSSHPVTQVSYPDGDCNFLFSPISPYEMNTNALNELTKNSKYSYVITPDKKLYYLNKNIKKIKLIDAEEKCIRELCEDLKLESFANKTEVSCLIKNINANEIKLIKSKTNHIHCKGYFKTNKPGSPMSEIEAANGGMYQLFAGNNFPTSYAVRNQFNQVIGILSVELPGFIPNREKHLTAENLHLASQKVMIKERSGNEKQTILSVFEKINSEITPLLERDTPSGLISCGIGAVKSFYHYLIGDENFTATNMKPVLENFIREGKAAINSLTFGHLESLRLLLIDRKSQIKDMKDANHLAELKSLNECINKLSDILLSEITIYIKRMNEIDKELKDNWIDIELERKKPNSPYANLKIEKKDGVLCDIPISWDDIINFRIQRDQANLFARYWAMDIDGHNRNLGADGKFLDGDLALILLIYYLLSETPLWPKPDPHSFDLDLEDLENFPDLLWAKFRYWVTQSSAVDRSADTLSRASGVEALQNLSQNFFSGPDAENYKNLKHSPVFSFQKYIETVFSSLLNENIFTALAKLHISEQMQMQDENGKLFLLLFPEYKLNFMNCETREPETFYLEFTDKGISYEVIGLDGQLKKNIIPWSKLPQYQKINLNDILKDDTFEKNKYKDYFRYLLFLETSKLGITPPGIQNDVKTRWIQELTNRAFESKRDLVLQSLPLKNILEQHSDFVWENIENQFKTFIENKRAEYSNPDKQTALHILEDAINFDELKKSYDKLVAEVLAPRIEETLEDFVFVSPRP